MTYQILLEEDSSDDTIYPGLQPNQKQSGTMPTGKRQVCQIPKLSETAKKNLKTAGKVALGVGIVAVVAGALLAYMHFSGLGINQAGFAALGAKIKAFWDATHTMSNGQVFLEVILPTVGGLGVTGLLIAKREPIGHKINLQKRKYWKSAKGFWEGSNQRVKKGGCIEAFKRYFKERAISQLGAVDKKIQSYNQANGIEEQFNKLLPESNEDSSEEENI